MLQTIAWTGGSRPPQGHKGVRKLQRRIFRECIHEIGTEWFWSGGLNTSPLEYARILWKRARYDAWATLRGPNE